MTWSVMLLAMVGTLLIRIPVAALTTDWVPSPWLARRLASLAPAAVAALLAITLCGSQGSLATPTAAEIVAVGVTTVVMRRTSQLAVALAAGLTVAVLLH